MKQLCTTLCSLLALSALGGGLSASAGDGFARMSEKGVSVGVNPSGSAVFGYNGRSGDESQFMWLFDVNEKTTASYPTDLVDLADAEGQVMWLTDDLVGVGTFRDEDWFTNVNDGLGGYIEEYPLNTACIWKDGRRIPLDHNQWEDPSTFVAQDGTLPNMNNGFYAMRISEDGSKIVGYLKAFTYMLPVCWNRNADGSYTSTMMHRETGEFFFQWVGASADCSRVVMNTKLTGGESYIWDGDGNHWIFKYSDPESDIYEVMLTALSPSGNLAIMSCMRDGKQAYGVYDFRTGEVKWIAVPEGSGSTNWFAANVVTDRGDGFICDYNYRLHYFNTELGINIPFASYLESFGSAMVMEDTGLSAKALVRMISADGRTICGNNLMYGNEDRGWIVRLPDSATMLFALSNCQLLSQSPTSMMLKWVDPKLPEGASMKRYMVEVDDAEAVEAEVLPSDDEFTRASIACTPGSHKVRLYAVAEDADGKEWESVKQDLELIISEETSLFFYEDLTDSKVDEQVMAYIYSHDTFHAAPATDSSVLNFRLDAGDFYDLTPFWYTCGFSSAQWHTYLESRWFDASSYTDGFYFTWQNRNMTINDETRLDANNLLKLEYTTDGENWTELYSTDGVSNGAKWNANVVDLSDLAGQQFRLRFHAQGGGRHACEWRVDNYGLMPASAMYDAPQGLMVTQSDDKGNKLAWKNNRGEYEVSYNYNSPMTFNNNLGNAGQPFYTACDYGPTKLKAFAGKYITAVSTMIYEPESVEQANHTKVQAVIFDEKGNELSRGTLADDAPWYEPLVSTAMPIHHINLDTPVLIEEGQTYRVSILITDYVAEMCPIWYFSASDDYIAGVTDLYSDDNLQTWNSVSDYFSTQSDEEYDLYGRCIFNIRPCISDAPEVSPIPYCQDQWYYQVYRNGELLPGGIAYFTQQSVLDAEGGDATYTVQSYRKDGSVSAMSEPLVYVDSAVDSVMADDGAMPRLVREGDLLIVAGDFDSVAIYDLMGVKVASSRVVNLRALPHGIYVVTVTKGGKTLSAKYAL